MSLVTELFESDSRGTPTFETELLLPVGANVHRIRMRTFLDFEARCKYVSLLIPRTVHPMSVLPHLSQNFQELISAAESEAENAGSTPGSGITSRVRRPIAPFKGDGVDIRNRQALPFTGRVLIYTQEEVPPFAKKGFCQEAEQKGIYFAFRGPDYAAQQQPWPERGFILHSLRDRFEFVLPLANRLRAMMAPAAYDDFSMEPGKRQRERIEAAFSTWDRCVLVISPHALANDNWFWRDCGESLLPHLSTEGVVLPIWCGVSREEFGGCDPRLARLPGLDWVTGPDQVARGLYSRLVSESRPQLSLMLRNPKAA